MGPLPVLSDDEEQILVKWITDCCEKGLCQRKLGIQLSVEEFLTINKRRKSFK
jgi:hypothetical protein